MNLRPGTVADAGPVAELIASFQSELTVDPSGAGAERYLASVSPRAEREYLESPRYFYIVAEQDGAIAGFIAIRDNSHSAHLSSRPAPKRSQRKVQSGKMPSTFSRETVIGEGWSCTQALRGFFESQIGKSFGFNVSFESSTPTESGTHASAVTGAMSLARKHPT